MTSIDSLTLEVTDLAAAERFYKALGVADRIDLRVSDAPTSGFRAFTLSLKVSQPAGVNRLAETALAAGATALKPAAKSLWGYGGIFQAPDGTIWQFVTSAKKDTAPDSGAIDDVVLLLGVSDMAATKKFYVAQGLTLAKSFGRKYAEFDSPAGTIKLALYGRRGLAKLAGVSPEGSGSHRIALGSTAGPFTDPDGFVWEATGH